MDILATVAEQKIREAMARGEFDNLPGAGKPLVMEDYSGIPEELRMAYKVLKNAGCVPPEVELRKEIVTLQNLLATLEEGEERRTRLRELNFKLLKLNSMRRRPVDLEAFPEYREKLYERLAG
ncbi:MAG TPA: DnaJ family domain-containing protein [Geobacteraceae bacterium]